MWVPWSFLILLLLPAALSAEDLKKYEQQSDITCSQALTRCSVVDKTCVLPPCAGVLPPCTSALLKVSSFSLEPALCSKATADYEPCLLIRVLLRDPADADTDPDTADTDTNAADTDISGEAPDDSGDEDCALTLCYISAPNLQSCKEITFSLKSSALRNREEPEVTVTVQDHALLGSSSVRVTVDNESQEVRFPDLSAAVCSQLKHCKPPELSQVIQQHRDALEMKTEVCVKKKGMNTCWPSERIIPLHAVTHCMCFQAWWNSNESSSRSEFCPYEKHKGFRGNALKNVTLSVKHIKANEGSSALRWNLSAPCVLEVAVWLCHMEVHLGGGCTVVPGFRQNNTTWLDKNRNTAWTSGEFLDVKAKRNLLPCVMFEVDGVLFGPLCEDYTPRVRWICLLMVALLLVVLLAVGVCALRVRHEEWLSNSNPIHHSQGLRGEVLLVHSSASDPSFSDTVCWFATWLFELGFSVSLDLWNQADVGKLGPMPWLHSRLQQVQKHGGKTLFLLSHEAALRAQTYSERWSSALNAAAGEARETSWPWNADVFSSALGSLFSSRLQGGADEHFALVQLESESLELPELFHGLKLYQLPSDSQQLLADLHTGHLGSLGAQLKRFLWTWRASASLEKTLRSRERAWRSRTESTLTHMEALSMEKDTEEEEEEEKQPLKDPRI